MSFSKISETHSRKNKHVAHGESSFQNMKTSCSIPSETRAQSNNGEPIHHGREESNGEIPQRESSFPCSTGRGLIHQLYGKFTEIVNQLLLEAGESQRQQCDSNYRTLAHESTRVLTSSKG